jgi:hypothetical protein
VALEPADIPLDGIVLPDARTGRAIDLARAGRVLVSLIRHRY